MAMTQTTTLNRQWLIKTGIFFVVLLGFGVWGLYDATVKYPAMGRDYAEFQLWQYLSQAQSEGRLHLPGLGTDDAAAEIERLRAKPAQQGSPLSALESAKLEWLRAVTLFGAGLATPETTTIENAPQRLAELTATWQAKNPPKPLAAYDIPVQWVFVVVGLGGALWIGALFVRVRSARYGWDPEEKRLHLPGGATLVPTDVAEYDRRKWDKFLMFLKIHEGHAALGGREIKLDLLRYTPLEEWVVEMERTAFPERFEEKKADEEPPAVAEPATA